MSENKAAIQPSSLVFSDLKVGSAFILVFRWITLVLVGILLLTQSVPGYSFVSSAYLLIAAFAYNLFITLFRSKAISQSLSKPYLLGVDIVFSILLIGISGGWRSPYFLYSLSSIMTAAFFFQVKGALYSVTSFSFLYLVAILANGWTPARVARMGEIDSYISHFFTFFLVAGVVAFLSHLLSRLRFAMEEIRKLHQKEEELRVMKERERIAHEMHDSVVQSLSGAGLLLDAYLKEEPSVGRGVTTLKDVRELLSESIKNIRYAIFNLRYHSLEGGFIPFLQNYAAEFSRINSISVDCAMSKEVEVLNENQQKNLYRIVREALANVRKHAKASQVAVGLDFYDSALSLVISDDGRGFDYNQAIADTKSRSTLGLLSMRQAAEEIGGSFVIKTASEQGTEITVRVPLDEPQAVKQE